METRKENVNYVGSAKEIVERWLERNGWSLSDFHIFLEKVGVKTPIEIVGTDRKMLELMINQYQGRPVGIDSIATSLGEEVDTIEDVYEPYLIQIGFISRTPRGRIVMPPAYEHLGYPYLG